MPLPEHLTLEIVTPERSVVSVQVDEAQVPGADGSFGVLPGHTPLLATLQVGELWYRIGQETCFVAVSFGFAEVLPDRVTILAQIAESAEEIDVTRAETAEKRAQDRLVRPMSDMDFERARLAMLKSLIRLQVASRARTRG
ncbi:MAG: ATP synthase F1 subunit epsilon [Acidobacteria bacterium]|jgi:F-type H+-transporting ATPase subunit epsilon|nr:ATP synthase F1 subunit epsilon [Acidobacteriota bacterium]MDP7691211.1 F0F1 ATP synthase subunit epsilon [Vicinamibacterales bacterium]HJN44340.1 F0F1 ATP synthase subunit epsilon [Vicinamibacterales bacterium]|tara:strand:- start:7221 stop:7643 length:423 start_codon:yes stop_codon:yes gene_type:complete